MHRLYEVRKSKAKAKERSLDHLRVHGSHDGRGHVIEHHYDNGDIEQHDFRHPEENAHALLHLADAMGMPGPNAEEGDEISDSGAEPLGAVAYEGA